MGCSGSAPKKRPYFPDLNTVDTGTFVTPVKRLGVSGGTAPFFSLELRDPNSEFPPNYYIGKDVSRAIDEVHFYEKKRELEERGKTGWEPMLEFMFGYLGVVESEVEEEPDVGRMQLLVLENLRSTCKDLRMLDIKIGQKTAAANWQGKTRWHAYRQRLMDSMTNSQSEGFRLEGFDNQPPSLRSLNPLLDIRVNVKSNKSVKKARRFMMQRMSAPSMFLHFFDVHQAPAEPPEAPAKVWSCTEVAELVSLEVLFQLCRLAFACRRCPAPQKWIGSSVALGFDAGELPLRSTTAEEVRKGVCVKIFDWGKSEFNTVEKHQQLSTEDKRDRIEFWTSYKAGVERLGWQAIRAYYHRFANEEDEWGEVVIKIKDFDSASRNESLGNAVVKLEETPAKTVPLLSEATGEQEKGPSAPSTVTYSVTYLKLPAGARLRGVWRIKVIRAENLKVGDPLQQTSDPCAEVLATSKDGSMCFRQDSCMIETTLNPTWDETFELPLVVPGTNALESTLEAVIPGLGKGVDFRKMFPTSETVDGDPAVENGLKAWSTHLKSVMGKEAMFFSGTINSYGDSTETGKDAPAAGTEAARADDVTASGDDVTASDKEAPKEVADEVADGGEGPPRLIAPL